MTTGSLFSQLNMGKGAMMAQQSGLSTAGHNIANVGNDDFSRQRVDLSPLHHTGSRFGSGVNLDGVARVTDRFLTQRLIAEQSRGGGVEVRQQGLERMEKLFAEVEGFGLRDALNDFWAAWGSLANNPEGEIYRRDLINKSQTLATRISGLGRDFQQLRQEFNGRISQQVERVNELAKLVASLNESIQQSGHGAGQTNDLRDKREGALKELSELVQIDWFEDDDSLVNVSVANGFPLVNGRRANQLEASFRHDEVGFFSLLGVDPKGISQNLTNDLQSGALNELLNLRDGTVVRFIDRLDELASELAFRVNQAHNSGTGLNADYEELRSSFALKEEALQQPLPFLRDGLFRIHLVGEESQKLETYEVELIAGRDTVNDVINRINATVGDPNILRAELNSDGSVSLVAAGAYNFVLGEDETDFSVVMGFNNFFENLRGAADFKINPRLEERPNRISTGKDLLPGDNSVALAIHQLQFSPTMEGEAITFDEFYNGMLAELGVMINRSQDEAGNQRLILDQFKKLRDEMSSVNMDEEVADMVQYQRGFDAAAKFLSTIDEMTETVISM